MDYRRKVRRNKILFLFSIMFFVIGCSFLIGLTNFLKSILFSLPALVLLPFGGYYIIMHYEGRKQYLIFIIWLSFTFAVTAFLGMLIDRKSYPLDWGYIFIVTGLVLILVLVFALILTPMYKAILKFWKNG